MQICAFLLLVRSLTPTNLKPRIQPRANMRRARGLPVFLAALFVISLFSAPASANPAVPYCHAAGGIGGGSSASTDLILPEVCEQATGRVFPEAIADSDYLTPTGPNGFTGGSTGFATDYVSFFEFEAGLQYLAGQFPDYIEVHQVALSHGNTNLLDGPERNPIYVLEISNENSPIARDEKLNLLFMLSIHGNEKGGREGGFRVLEDLVKNVGFATETVQNGAGMAQPMEKPTGGTVSTYHDFLDFMNIFLLFPNADGWACDELEYGLPTTQLGGGCPGLFTRGNGGGTDLNRQTPTIGWQNPNRNVMGEPESGGDNDGSTNVGFGNWLVNQRDESNGTFQWDYAIDIHGMLNHKNFGAIMLPAGSFSPQEMHRSLRLAETLKERWNADPHFSEWRTLFQAEEAAWQPGEPAYQAFVEATKDDFYSTCAQGDPFGFGICPEAGSALYGGNPGHRAGSSQFAEYYTVIDAIGYTDSGFNGDFFAQSTGLNAPGYDIELAYNHLNCSAQYECGAQFNDYHVWMVRHIVKSFMDAAALDAQISYETGGLRTAYVPSQFVATNLDDVDAEGNPAQTPGGWADQNPGDDQWDYGPDQPFHARPAKYWEDIVPFVCENCGTTNAIAGVLQPRNAAELDADTLANYDNLVIAGSAINQFVSGAAGENEVADGTPDAARLQTILEWVEAGGNLVLTDAALSFFDLSGLTTDAVSREAGYMGGIRMDLEHEMLNKVRGGVKQTYEPTPLGWGTTGSAPNWGIDPQAFAGLGGSVAGLVCPGRSLDQNCEGRNVALGYLDLGEGRIQFMGAILPDPTEEFYHPYGLDDYATTYSGNQVVRNMLGWDEVFTEPPVVISDGRIIQTENEPGARGAEGEQAEGADGKEKGAPGTPFVAVLALLGALAFLRRRR